MQTIPFLFWIIFSVISVTGSSSSHPTLTAGSETAGKRWCRSWRPCISRHFAKRLEPVTVNKLCWNIHRKNAERLSLSLWTSLFKDLRLRIQKHTEVETVDLVLKLKDKLVCVFSFIYLFIFNLNAFYTSTLKQSRLCCVTLRMCLILFPLFPQTQAEREQLPVRAETLAKLQSHIDSIILSLPDDLQGILHKPASPWPWTHTTAETRTRWLNQSPFWGVWRV